MRVRFTHLFVFVADSTVLFGCASTRYTYPTYQRGADKMLFAVLKPISIIGVIEEGNKATYDSIASEESKRRLQLLIQEVVGSNSSPRNLTLDTAVYKRMYKELLGVGGKLTTVKNKIQRQEIIDSYKISPEIDSIMKSQDIQQLVVSYQKGFYRSKKNYRSQNWKSLGVGLLTLGTYVPVPIKSNSLIYTWVVDREKKTIVFYNQSLREIDPTDQLAIGNQICELYQGFYTSKSSTGSCFHQ